MAKLTYPRHYAPIDAAQYAPGYEGVINVWLNPPRSLLLSLFDALQSGEGVPENLAQIWQDWTPEDVNELLDETFNHRDFYAWLIGETFRVINDYREKAKKNLGQPPES